MKHLYPSGLLSEHPPLRSEAQVMAEREKDAEQRREQLRRIFANDLLETARSKPLARRLRPWETLAIALLVLAFMSGIWVILYHAVVAMIEMWVGK